jgi:hypothetical protein
MNSIQSYNQFVSSYYSIFALVLQLLTFGFGLASCVTRFRSNVVWITALFYFFDTLVASIFAYFPLYSKSTADSLMSFLLASIILSAYMWCRITYCVEILNEKNNWNILDNITIYINYAKSIVFSIPIIITVLWLIAIIILRLWNIFVWPLKYILAGSPKTVLIQRSKIKLTFTSTTGMSIRAINASEVMKLT